MDAYRPQWSDIRIAIQSSSYAQDTLLNACERLLAGARFLCKDPCPVAHELLARDCRQVVAALEWLEAEGRRLRERAAS